MERSAKRRIKYAIEDTIIPITSLIAINVLLYLVGGWDLLWRLANQGANP